MPRADLTAFLTAQLDEDEQWARKALEQGDDYWEAVFSGAELAAIQAMPSRRHIGAVRPKMGVHVVRHDPARALREVEAKRAIVELAAEATGLDDTVDAEFRSGPRDLDAEPYVGDRILRALAAVYSDHPDYDPAWATSG